jgi:hypothetical protein
MKRAITTILTTFLLTVGGQAFAAGPPVAPGGLNAGLGCSAQCIQKALVTPTMTGARLEVETDTPARIAIRISDQAPGFIDGTPWIPNPDYAAHTVSTYTSRTFQIDRLAAGTRFHILVTATDAEGRSAYRLGTFETLDPPPLPPAVQTQAVRVMFYKVKIKNDADSVGKGEIALNFCVKGDCGIGEGAYLKLGSGQTYAALETRTVADGSGEIELRVDGDEYDFATANEHSSPRLVVDLDDLDDNVVGGDYGNMPYGHDAYVSFESPSSDSLEFRVYAWVDVVD